MNPDHSTDHDEELHALLRTWRLDSGLPPGFVRGVWRRIASSEARATVLSRLFMPLVRWWELAVRRPAFATAYLALFLALGLLAGFWQAENYARSTEQAWRAAYVQSVSPTTASHH